MTGCHYKKCLGAASFIEALQVPPTVGFQRGSSPSTAPAAWPWQGLRASLHTAAAMSTACLHTATGKTKQNIWSRILSTNAHKTNTVVTHKGEANFSFVSQWKEFWNPADAVYGIMHTVSCNPTCAINYQQSKLQIHTKKTFQVQSLSQFCSKSYCSCPHLFSTSTATIKLKRGEKILQFCYFS